jgi:hypothetical protein
VRALEDALDRERSRTRRDGRSYGSRYRDDFWDVRDDLTDVGERKLDEVARIFTGAVRASLEALRVSAESTRDFVDDALERSIPEYDEDPTDVARRLPADLSRSWSRSLDRKLDAPGRAAERFERAWTHDEGGRRRRRRVRTRYEDRYDTTVGKEVEPVTPPIEKEDRKEETGAASRSSPAAAKGTTSKP